MIWERQERILEWWFWGGRQGGNLEHRLSGWNYPQYCKKTRGLEVQTHILKTNAWITFDCTTGISQMQIQPIPDGKCFPPVVANPQLRMRKCCFHPQLFESSMWRPWLKRLKRVGGLYLLGKSLLMNGRAPFWPLLFKDQLLYEWSRW